MSCVRPRNVPFLTHLSMTNTRITDAEILEKTQPCILRQFQLRPNSGGIGRNRGGDGVIREFEFSEAMHVATIGERRVTQPYGMKGGGPGERGAFFFSRKQEDGEYVTIKTKPCCTLKVKPGDRVILHTPGEFARSASLSIPDMGFESRLHD